MKELHFKSTQEESLGGHIGWIITEHGHIGVEGQAGRARSVYRGQLHLWAGADYRCDPSK